jgi:hypothetical protein
MGCRSLSVVNRIDKLEHLLQMVSAKQIFVYIYIKIKNVNNEFQFKLTADGASP